MRSTCLFVTNPHNPALIPTLPAPCRITPITGKSRGSGLNEGDAAAGFDRQTKSERKQISAAQGFIGRNPEKSLLTILHRQDLGETPGWLFRPPIRRTTLITA